LAQVKQSVEFYLRGTFSSAGGKISVEVCSESDQGPQKARKLRASAETFAAPNVQVVEI